MKNMNSFVRINLISLHTFVYICHYVKEKKKLLLLLSKDSTNTRGSLCAWKKSDCCCPVQCRPNISPSREICKQYCQSPSNKVLRWAIFIVWMTPGRKFILCALVQ